MKDRFPNQINGKLSNKKTSKNWSKSLNLKFINIAGFPSSDFFDKVAVSVEDFLAMAAQCEVEKPQITSRREASKLKKTLDWNLK